MPECALTRQQMAEARKAFAEFDKDGNSTISRSELYNGIAKMGDAPPRDAVEAMLQQFDQDGDGDLDFAEFIVLYMSM